MVWLCATAIRFSDLTLLWFFLVRVYFNHLTVLTSWLLQYGDLIGYLKGARIVLVDEFHNSKNEWAKLKDNPHKHFLLKLDDQSFWQLHRPSFLRSERYILLIEECCKVTLCPNLNEFCIVKGRKECVQHFYNKNDIVNSIYNYDASSHPPVHTKDKRAFKKIKKAEEVVVSLWDAKESLTLYHF